MNIHEHQAKDLLKEFEIPVPKGFVIYNVEEIFKISGSVVQYGCTLPVLKWLDKFEKKTLLKTKYFLTCKDWIRFKLTNEFNNDFTERSVSPGDIKKTKFSLDIFKLCRTIIFTNWINNYVFIFNYL